MSEYFSHDYDCRSDEKIMDLMAEMSWAGYGLFWGLIELLYQNNGTMQTQYKRIAFALGSNEASVKAIVEDFDLFTLEGDEFWSESVNTRLDERANKSEKARESANKRWDKQRKDANAVRTQSDSNAKKDSIVKNNIIKEKEFKEEINAYSNEYSLPMLKAFFDYWSEWNQTKTKMRWQMEKTWDNGRRLSSWRKRSENYNKSGSKNLYPDYKDSSFD